MKGKRIISSLLSMAMVFSLNAGMSFAEEVPVTEEPVIEEQPVEEQVVEEQPVIEEEPVIEEQQPTQEEPEVEQQEEAENEYPAQTFTGTTPDGKITVEVTAGEGALPKDASMRVENVNKTKVTNLVDPLIDGKVDSLSAVNVIFTDVNGNEVEPLTEIIVNIKTNELSEANRYQLVHIDQADNAERIAEEKVIGINDKEATFATDVFSIYVIVSVIETGSIDFDETFGSNHLVVHAPDGAFAPGTEMVISSVDNTDSINAIVSKAGSNQVLEIFMLDISFVKDGVEVEPNLPVEVTWESAYLNGVHSSVVHVLDNGEIEAINASIDGGVAIFTTSSFSEYGVVTEHQSSVLKEYFEFDPSGMIPVTEFDSITSGAIASNAPRFQNYAFKNATVMVDGNEVELLEVGAFIAKYDDPTKPDEYNVFYRTEETMKTTDMIVLLAKNEKIKLHYSSAPLNVTYRIIYDGNTYTLSSEDLAEKRIPAALQAVLGEDAEAVVFNGPEIIAENTPYNLAINAQIPRGYSATTTISRGSSTSKLGDLGEPTEPTYTTDGSVITGTGELKLKDTYSISSSNVNREVVMNLSKRNSFTFDASYFLHTKYTGGTTSTFGNRITSDITLSEGKKTFSADTVSWRFTTTNVSDNQEPRSWWLDALEINGTSLNIPYVADNGNYPVSKTTVLPSGTEITVTLVSIDTSNQRPRRTYEVLAKNAYENLVITSGNIYDSGHSEEIIPEVLDNVNFEFYGFSTSDNGHDHPNSIDWQKWTVGNPIAVYKNQSTQYSRFWTMYGFDQETPNAMRFSIPEGYANPEIAYVTSTEGDLSQYIEGLWTTTTKPTKTQDGYYPVPYDEGQTEFNFRITGLGSDNKLGLLRIRSQLMRFGVSYSSSSDGPANPENLPEFDNGGYYGDGSLQGYNVEDNSIITISKNKVEDPSTDPNNSYTFLYYTIEGDPDETTYAPGQKLEGELFYKFISFAKYDEETGEYVVPLVANWAKKAEVETVDINLKFYLDGQLVYEPASVHVAKGSSIYIDIDSDEMEAFMTEYNWDLFYDEAGSNPYIDNIQQDRDINIQCYSKFYVYHSGSGKLELHTKKELLDSTTQTIGNFDVYNSVSDRIPDGFLYGGYYLNYDADTNNEVLNAAKNDALHGEITPAQVSTLSNGGYVNIETCSVKYDEMIAGTNAWSSPQESPTTAVPSVVKSEHNPTIYYIKEVPDAYLSNFYEIIYNKNTKELTGLYLISGIDDLNYQRTGFYLQKTDDKTATVVTSLTFKQEQTGKQRKISANNALGKDGVINRSYLTYWKAVDKYFATGSYTVTPFWITPDGIPISNKTRTINITKMTKDGISKTD